MLFADTDRAAALLLAEKMRSDIESLQLPHPRSTTASCVTASRGIATLQATNAETASLFVAADEALYRAKTLGRIQTRVSFCLLLSCAAIT